MPSVSPLRSGAAVLLSAAAVLASGCGGDRYGPGQSASDDAPAVAAAPNAPASPPPAATTPLATPPVPTSPPAELGAPRTLGGVTWTPLALYAGPTQFSIRDGYLASVVPADSGVADGPAELHVSPGGGKPRPAAGAGPVPWWGRPHVGSDASGRVVVTYPRCSDPASVGTCDIYQWNASTEREVVLRGISGETLAETEAVLDMGDALVVREKRATLTATELIQETPPLTTLLYKPRGGPLRVVTRHGGRAIDLRGDRIADLFLGADQTAGACGVTEARALNLEGFTVAARQVICGENGSSAVGPKLANGHLRFAIAAGAGQRVALDHDLTTGATLQARLTQPFDWFEAEGATSGYAARTVRGASTCFLPDPPGAPSRCRFSRATDLQWKPIEANWRISALDPPVKE